jgi:FkbM family methyltransferase
VFPLRYQITYSQNREDLILAGILRDTAVGFYVDVGANHPEFHSVTKLFYDRGWSGINIEPNERLHAELSAQRPRDVNIRAGVSSQPGSLTFHSFAVDGLSTFSSDLKAEYERMGLPPNEQSVIEVVTLSQLLHAHRPAGEIHFLKIDVEGLEMEVLLGNDWERYRPWILCVESTMYHPGRQEASLAFLTAFRYERVFNDGINEYYVAKERREVWNNFSYSRHVILPGFPVPSTYIAQHGSPAIAPERANVQTYGHVNDLLALDADAFVSAAYHALLRRPPDAAGLRNYVQELSSGASKLSILSKLRNSQEGRRQGVVLSGYRGALIRQWMSL